MIALWRSGEDPDPLSRPYASGVSGAIDYLCPECHNVVFASMADGQVQAGDRAFCPACRTACEVPPPAGSTGSTAGALAPAEGAAGYDAGPG